MLEARFTKLLCYTRPAPATITHSGLGRLGVQHPNKIILTLDAMKSFSKNLSENFMVVDVIIPKYTPTNTPPMISPPKPAAFPTVQDEK